MSSNDSYLLSVVIPVFNESGNIDKLYAHLKDVLASLQNAPYEIIYVDDGSTDNSTDTIRLLAQKDKNIRLVVLSKNFGKEIATSAGLHHAHGDAVIIIDADGQHPVELIPTFVEKWQNHKNKVVVGVRKENQNEGFIKHFGSKIFYALFNSLTGFKLVPGSTDFRLIDKEVCAEFCQLTERNRITRGLIDWLGYKTTYIEFKANPRMGGDPGYSTKKLIKLAFTSFMSLSFIPLYVMGYIGAILTPVSLIVGIFMVIEDFFLDDPLHLNLTGSGFLGILTVFLIGLVLISQGLMALYISYIYQEVRNRPLFVINKAQSVL